MRLEIYARPAAADDTESRMRAAASPVFYSEAEKMVLGTGPYSARDTAASSAIAADAQSRRSSPPAYAQAMLGELIERIAEWNFKLYALGFERTELINRVLRIPGSQSTAQAVNDVRKKVDDIVAAMKEAQDRSRANADGLPSGIKTFVLNDLPAGLAFVAGSLGFVNEKGAWVPNVAAVNAKLLGIMRAAARLRQAVTAQARKRESRNPVIAAIDGRYRIREIRYWTVKPWGSLARGYANVWYDTLWDVFRSIDHRIDTAMSEVRWIQETGGILDRLTAVCSSADMELSGAVARALDGLEKPMSHEKRLAKIVLFGVAPLLGLQKEKQAHGILGLAGEILGVRGREVREIIAATERSRLEYLRTYTDIYHAELKALAQRFLDLADARNQAVLSRTLRDEMPRIGNVLREPQFAASQKALRFVVERIQGEDAWEEIIMALGFFVYQVRVSEALHSFMTEYRSAVVRDEMRDETWEARRARIFEETFSGWLEENPRAKEHEALFHAVFYMPAFVPHYGRRRSASQPRPESPLFTALSSWIAWEQAGLGKDPEALRRILGIEQPVEPEEIRTAFAAATRIQPASSSPVVSPGSAASSPAGADRKKAAKKTYGGSPLAAVTPDLARIIRYARTARGWSNRALAARAFGRADADSQITALEDPSPGQRVTLRTLEKIARAFDLTLDELLEKAVRIDVVAAADGARSDADVPNPAIRDLSAAQLREVLTRRMKVVPDNIAGFSFKPKAGKLRYLIMSDDHVFFVRKQVFQRGQRVSITFNLTELNFDVGAAGAELKNMDFISAVMDKTKKTAVMGLCDILDLRIQTFPRQGLGSVLMAFMLTEARLKGMDRFLIVNSTADSFYEKFGFKFRSDGDPGLLSLDLSHKQNTMEGIIAVAEKYNFSVFAAAHDGKPRFEEIWHIPAQKPGNEDGHQSASSAVRRGALMPDWVTDLYEGIAQEGWRKFGSYAAGYPKYRGDIGDLINRGKSILSVGSGRGELESELADAGNDVIALDYVAGMVLTAKARGLPAVRADAHFLPFMSGAFDVVVLNESIGHMRPDEALAEARRVLKDGGELILTSPAPTEWGTSTAGVYRKYSLEELWGFVKGRFILLDMIQAHYWQSQSGPMLPGLVNIIHARKSNAEYPSRSSSPVSQSAFPAPVSSVVNVGNAHDLALYVAAETLPEIDRVPAHFLPLTHP